jgi:two-component sensor histidine kinase
VQDNGPGVKPEHRDAIFQRFRQGDGGSARHFGGTGLGLSIVKEFVGLHRGAITVSDAPGGGALFTVELPRTAPLGTEVSTAPAGSGEATAIPHLVPEEPVTRPRVVETTQRDGRGLVLVIDDNLEMNRFISEVLAAEYRTATALDGREGLEKALALHPDLILSDVMMPRMDGEQLVREVRARPELDGIPVVLLTAKADDATRLRLLREGAQDYLVKPFSVLELHARVGNLVAVKRAREVLQEQLASRSHDVAALARDISVRQRELQAALKEKEVLLKEVHHRVKNNLQLMSSLLNLQMTSTKGRRSRELYAESQSRIKAMALVHETLYRTNDLARINFGEYVRSLVTHLFRSYAASSDAIGVQIRVDEIALGVDQAIPCGLIINELVANSLKHAFPAGRKGDITIDCHLGPGGGCELIIADTGVGFPKGFAFREAGSAGLELVRTLVDQLGGTIEGREGSGVEFSVCFPGSAR